MAVSLNLVGLPLFAVVQGSSRQKDDINLLLSSAHADILHRLSNFLLWLKSDGVATCYIYRRYYLTATVGCRRREPRPGWSSVRLSSVEAITVSSTQFFVVVLYCHSPRPGGFMSIMLILAFSWFLAHLGGTTGVGLEEGLDLTDMSLALARGVSAELILIIK